MGVKIHGMGSLTKKLDRLDPLTVNALRNGVYKAGLKVESDAKQVVPVDSGALKGSIGTSSKDGGMTVAIGTNLEYAPYVELGTSKMRAQPYLQPSLQKNKSNAQKLVTTEIRNAYRGL